MLNYARIVNATIVELFTPPDGFTIDDCFHPDVASTFVVIPDGIDPAPGWTYDGTFAPPLPPAPPTIQQQAATLLANPIITVSCAAVPALNGDYLLDVPSRSNITGIAVAINGGLGLPSGQATFNYLDITGGAHPWPAAQFLAFAQGGMIYVYNLSQAASGNSPIVPDATLII